jgi:hypothetical protein
MLGPKAAQFELQGSLPCAKNESLSADREDLIVGYNSCRRSTEAQDLGNTARIGRGD